MTIDSDQPFILLDDARTDGGGARLYVRPIEVVSASRLDEVAPALAALRAAAARGLHAAGYIGYEAGLALEGRLDRLPVAQGGAPLLWFGLFEGFSRPDADALAAMLGDPAGAWAGAPRPRIAFAAYAAAFDRVAGYIAAGDIYQANLSFRADVPMAGDPLALYAAMRSASRGGWGGVVFTGRHWLLSCSPELFFTLEEGRLTARPMKGTARRDADPARDAALAGSLAADAKERAENLMIVDLLRNDLARVAEAGSVAVPALFTVETYPTIHTLTSTVAARLAPGRDAVDVLAAIFPCGSVTGAPKIRAMEIIAGVEADARGPYTGSIGWLDPAGDAAFNVAIRTLAMEQGSRVAELGLGSAVVADSTAAGEWRECLAKGAFVTAAMRPFDLIETMRFDAAGGLVELERHLARMKASADALDFPFDRHVARNELQAATFRLRDPRRVRLMLSPSGALAVEVRPLPANPAVANVAMAPLPVAPGDFRLRHKTSDRAAHDDARRAAGTFEVLFTDPEGRLTEGSFTSLFVARGGRLVTPPLERGLLPGILREVLIAEGRAEEGDVAPADLAGGFFIGNSLRGLIPARLV
ncbi:aminodeoxychorismate synthase component I [Sphingomonas fennica]|uniref:Probable branched-chain-amino-acid aminotransferase n=1 Tax=Edaphosphingomonas fennica TaxID=114404 RepID=A0A2T4I050_9SPHN|nr:aminodeoxychorismate synthase component I [Sphingomonas fennica]PTD22126.1 aminodeoxychorismate synthase, component I [Sphingomonas fennica]